MMDEYINKYREDRDYFWRLPDGRVWSFAAAGWVEADDTLEEEALIDIADLAALRVVVLYYVKLYGGDMGELEPEPTPEELQKQFTDAIQGHLDAFARTRNYDNILSAATYATSTVPKFRAEGQYAVEARDATWAKGYEILGTVMAGQRPMPSLEEVLAELPPLAWPD